MQLTVEKANKLIVRMEEQLDILLKNQVANFFLFRQRHFVLQRV